MALDTFQQVVINMLASNQAEIQTMRDFLWSNLLKGKNETQMKFFQENYMKKVSENRDLILKNIQAQFNDGDINDLLTGVFGK